MNDPRDPAEYNKASYSPSGAQTLGGRDAATCNEASYSPDVDVCQTCGRNFDGELAESETRKVWQEVALRFLAMLESGGNARLTIRAIPFAFGLRTTGGKSEAQTAEEMNLGPEGRQVFNKEVRRLQRYCKARNNRNNKSAKAQNKYRENALNDHWRNQSPAEAAKSAIRRAGKACRD
jgi:hypothetical protein